MTTQFDRGANALGRTDEPARSGSRGEHVTATARPADARPMHEGTASAAEVSHGQTFTLQDLAFSRAARAESSTNFFPMLTNRTGINPAKPKQQ